jgi:ssDNA-binding Zn-finger/Zn-ribbon topoisomerase 1
MENEMTEILIRAIRSNEICPECQSGFLVKRKSQYGEFWGCSNFPKCTYIYDEKLEDERDTFYTYYADYLSENWGDRD